MAAKLEINDGNPWWLSKDIWIVPGEDPNGMIGIPVSGQANYVWAKVHNTGDEVIESAKVNFYWSNPAMGVYRSNSNLIGSAYADLDVGESKDVLCISPWIPVVVNNGHECIVVEVDSRQDPLPIPISDDFDPPSFHQIAQKNLQVLSMTPAMQFVFLPIQVSAISRNAKEVEIKIEKGQLNKDDMYFLFKQLGLKNLKELSERSIMYGVSLESGCHNSKETIGYKNLKLSINERSSKAVYVHLEQTNREENGYMLLNVTESQNGKIVGGNSILIIK